MVCEALAQGEGRGVLKYAQVIAHRETSECLLVCLPSSSTQEVCVVEEGEASLSLHLVRHKVCYYPYDCSVLLRWPEVEGRSNCPVRRHEVGVHAEQSRYPCSCPVPIYEALAAFRDPVWK